MACTGQEVTRWRASGAEHRAEPPLITLQSTPRAGHVCFRATNLYNDPTTISEVGEAKYQAQRQAQRLHKHQVKLCSLRLRYFVYDTLKETFC